MLHWIPEIPLKIDPWKVYSFTSGFSHLMYIWWQTIVRSYHEISKPVSTETWNCYRNISCSESLSNLSVFDVTYYINWSNIMWWHWRVIEPPMCKKNEQTYFSLAKRDRYQQTPALISVTFKERIKNRAREVVQLLKARITTQNWKSWKAFSQTCFAYECVSWMWNSFSLKHLAPLTYFLNKSQ